MLFGFLLHITSFSILQFATIWLSLQKLSFEPIITQLSTNEFLLAIVVATTTLFLIFKFSKKINLIKYLFYLILLIGAKAVFEIFYSNLVASIISLLLLVLYVSRKTLIIHNAVLGIAILGIATNLSSSLKPMTVILLMAIFSIYDIIAVYGSKYMIKLFKNFAHRGATLAFIYPKRRGRIDTNNLFILGTGDVAFPMLLIGTLTKYSLDLAVLAAIGSIVGATIVFYLLTIQKNKRAMPALPPIAFFTIAPVIAKLMFSF